MLTGGPSAWYAARLAGNTNASIFITGYQDEESPGRRLLDLAEHKSSTLDVGGMQVSVQCQVAKYSLSAHADGSELAAYAATLQPRQVALVHGDEEARMALRTLLTTTDVVLPANGAALTIRERRSGQEKVARPQKPVAVAAPTMPEGIRPGVEFGPEHIEELWEEVRKVPELRVVTARELAQVWYGEASEQEIWEMLRVLESDWDQRYFVRQQALAEAFRVRGQVQEEQGDTLQDLVGKVLFMQITHESSKPVLCRTLEPGGSVRVILPRGINLERNRFPFSAIIDVLGPYPEEEMAATRQTPPGYLIDLVKAARRATRGVSVHELAQQCEEGADYTLGDLCALAGLSGQSTEERLGIAKLVFKNPLLFSQQASVLDGEGLALYRLAPNWQEGLLYPEKREMPDQNEILRILEFAIGTPPRLYRRSVNPETGDVVLYFHFPEPAEREYGEAIQQAAEEAGVSITIAPNAHQGELNNVGRRYLQDEGIATWGTPSVYFDERRIVFQATTAAAPEAVKRAQERFQQETAWILQVAGMPAANPVPTAPRSTPIPAIIKSQPEGKQAAEPIVKKTLLPAGRILPQHETLARAQQKLTALPHCYKVGVDPRTRTIPVRFYFPEADEQRYGEIFQQLEAETGWKVVLHPQIHQAALSELAQNSIPAGLISLSSPSIYMQQREVYISCQGDISDEALAEAEQHFTEETGWILTLDIKTGENGETGDVVRMTLADAQAVVRQRFLRVLDLYRIGTDEKRHAIWLHFNFPDVAGIRYAADIREVEEETGWKIELHPHASQKALKDLIKRLLAEDGSEVSKITLYMESKTANVTSIAFISAAKREELRERFTQETGWNLQMNLFKYRAERPETYKYCPLFILERVKDQMILEVCRRARYG